jgi:SAM-dependent methyltransferase
MKCILCNSEGLDRITSISSEWLSTRWKNEFNFDISSEINDVKKIELFECRTCKLNFYMPSIVGSPKLYEYLEKFNWYYMEEKWEYKVALADLNDVEDVLEIGSGYGFFVRKILERYNIPVLGLESNPQAVIYAKKHSLPIVNKDFYNLSGIDAKFSSICSFQVLEHVINPLEFIKKSCELLKPNGKLIICVPNGKGWQHKLSLLLDMPPHHASLWNETTMKKMTEYFPLVLEKIVFEPLPLYHIDLYVDSLLRDLKISNHFIRRVSRFASRKVIFVIVKLFKYRVPLQGMGLYVVFRRSA